jgi:DNA-binding CsgD family transcriptional regulator
VTSDDAAALLERDESLTTLRDLLAEVRSGGEGRVAVIAGEAGVGKSTLLRGFCARSGARVLWGSCEPLHTPRPMGPLWSVAEAARGELLDLIAAGARAHEVVSALSEVLRGRAPTVLVLEDLHWADEATLDVLLLLASRIASLNALVVASYRDDEVDGAQHLRGVLAELDGHPRRLRLEPLSLAAVAELARDHGVDAGELYRATAGNPFFATEVLATGGTRLPDTVRDAVLARTARLSGMARALLEAISVIPGEPELWLIESMAGAIIGRLDECLASGVLTPGATSVAFRHELARRAIEESMVPTRRVGLHRAALDALAGRAGREPDAARLAHHAEAAADPDAVLHWAPRAAERAAASGAHREAASQYERALRYAEREQAEHRGVLWARYAEECRMSAQFERAIAAGRAALDCQRSVGDLLAVGDALRSLSRLLFFDGRPEEGEPLALEAVELLEGLPPGHELAMAYANMSQRRMVVEDTAGALAWGGRALRLARRLGDTEAEVYALTNVGAAELDRRRPGGRAKLEGVLELAAQHGLEDYVGRARTLLVLQAVRQREYALAARHLEAGLAYCTERGLDTWCEYLVAYRSWIELECGRWDEAADSSGWVLRRRTASHWARAWALTALGVLRARRGDADVAPPLAEAEALVRSTGELVRIGPVAAARAEAAWLAGRDALVPKLTDEVLALALEHGEPWLTGQLAYWRWQAGVREGLSRHDLAEPYRLAMQGDAGRAAARWRRIGCPYHAALALSGSDDDATVRQGLEELQQLGAKPAAAIIARRLRERGVRGVPRGPYAQTRSNRAGLTSREMEVLALLAEGLRNAEIAGRLVVSPKTVDHHVSAILRKLGVRNRSEAAAAAARLELTATG